VKSSDNSCFNLTQLKNIATNYNKNQLKKDRIVTSNIRSKKILWNAINEKLSSECSDEKCWSKFSSDNAMASKRFRPDMPSTWKNNPREWLSNFDIQKVMKQYESDTFKFLGVFPSDYDYKLAMNVCVAEELCNIDIQQLKKSGVTGLGIVFNTDPHYASGSHWVAVYIGLCDDKKGGREDNKFGFFYYDSNAAEASEYIQRLYASIKEQIEEKTQEKGKGKTQRVKKFEFKSNPNRHQFKNTECGMFSMNFIINMKKNKTFNKIVNEKLTDDMVFKKREEFYYKRES